MNEQQESPPCPPNPSRVARRALILAALVCRADLDDKGEGCREVDQRLRDWLGRIDLGDELDDSEATFLRTPFGQLTEQQRVTATWHAEGLLVVAWALGRMELLPHDQLVDPLEVTDSVALLGDEASELITSATLRPLKERRALREVMYALDCCLCALLRGSSPRDVSFYVEPSWWATLGLDPALTSKGELTLDDRPILEATEEQQQQVRWAVGERHRASIWLLGEYPVYATTPADT